MKEVGASVGCDGGIKAQDDVLCFFLKDAEGACGVGFEIEVLGRRTIRIYSTMMSYITEIHLPLGKNFRKD